MGKGRERRRHTPRRRGEWHRTRRFNRHHILNRINGGTMVESNLLRMDISRHRAWHFLFRNLSFLEVAKLLLRVQEWKEGRHEQQDRAEAYRVSDSAHQTDRVRRPMDGGMAFEGGSG